MSDKWGDRRILAIKVVIVLFGYWSIVPLVYGRPLDPAAMLWYGLFGTVGMIIFLVMHPVTLRRPKLGFFLTVVLLLALVVTLTLTLLVDGK